VRRREIRAEMPCGHRDCAQRIESGISRLKADATSREAFGSATLQTQAISTR
jgi:hypothetical protein